MNIALSDDFIQMKDDVARTLKNIERMSASDINQAVKELSAYKNDMDSYLNLVITWFRDVLLYKASGEASQIVFSDERGIIEKQAKAVEYEGLEQVFSGIEELKGRLKSNVNFDIALELLFINIRAIFQ